MNSLTLIFTAACLFAIAYRFYGLFLANRVMNLREERETPAVTYGDGHDYLPTNKYVLFGHHFAAIAAPRRPRFIPIALLYHASRPTVLSGQLNGI